MGESFSGNIVVPSSTVALDAKFRSVTTSACVGAVVVVAATVVVPVRSWRGGSDRKARTI